MSGSHEKLPKFFWVQLIAALFIGVLWLFKSGGHGDAEAKVDPTMANALKPIGQVAVAKPAEEAGAPRSGEEVVKKNCNVCHSIGLANAPKLDAGAKADWEARLAGGYDAVVASAIKGKGGMPPRGGDPTLTDDEISESIKYMLAGVGIETAEAAEAKPAAATAPKAEAVKEEVAVKSEEATKTEKVAEAPAKTEEAPKAEKVAEAVAKLTEAPKAEAVAAKTEVAATVEKVAAKPVEKTVKAVAATAVAAAPKAAAAVAKPVALVATELGESTYKASCFACHDSGVANSPKVGDKAVWAPRIAAGISELHTSAIKGKGAMPGKGGNPALSDQSVIEAVNFMVINSQ